MKKLFVIALAALATLTASAQQFGKVNFNEIVMLAPEMDAARETIAASQKEAEETYAAMVEEYQGKMNQYQQKQATWTAAIRESKERELMEIQNRIQEFQQSISQELQTQQNQLTAPIQEKANKIVMDIAKAKGPSSIFPRLSTSMSPRCWISPTRPARLWVFRTAAPSSPSRPNFRPRPKPLRPSKSNINHKKTPTQLSRSFLLSEVGD